MRRFTAAVIAASALASASPAVAQQATAQKISFTADNASHVYINGVKIGGTNNWHQEFIINNFNLQQGDNILGIVAWDSESIAAINGLFEMPDGNKFGTSSTGWKVFNADKQPNNCNAPLCTGLSKSANFVQNGNPLTEYANRIDVPNDWLDLDFNDSTWETPGTSVGPNNTHPAPWNAHSPTADPTWIWYGERNDNDPANTWDSVNFALFRFEFECVGDVCATEDEWANEYQIIDSPKPGQLAHRSWDDIIYQGGLLAAQTTPVFRGGTLSFKDFPGGNYTASFLVDDINTSAANGDNTINNAGRNPVLTGNLFGPGGMRFKGAGTTTLSGTNTYKGNTFIDEGTLRLGSGTGIARGSATSVAIGATFDLNYQSPTIHSITLNGGNGAGTLAQMMAATAHLKGGAVTGTITSQGGLINGVTIAHLNVRSGRTFLVNGVSLGNGELTGGQLWATDSDTATFNSFTLNSSTAAPTTPKQGSSIESALNNPGLVLGLGAKDDYSMRVEDGGFTYEGGNIFIYIDPNRVSELDNGIWHVLDFNRGDISADDYKKMFENTYVLIPSKDGTNHQFIKFSSQGKPVERAEITRIVKLIKGSLNIFIGEGNPDLNLCDLGIGEDCPGKPEIIDPTDPGEITIDKGLIPNITEQFPLMLVSDLRKIVINTLIPRNTDALGQAVATFNNRVADTIFERTPLRQFIELENDQSQIQARINDTISAAINGSSSESDESQSFTGIDQAEINAGEIPPTLKKTTPLNFSGKKYQEAPSLTGEYANRNGARAWIRGFSGTSSDYNGNEDKIFNAYDISASGGVVGADLSVSPTVQIGAYANYGDINLWQNSDLGNGAWMGNGWGGGITADYWSDNFYIQGLLGATKFTGEHQRTIKPVRALVTASEPKADRDANTIVGAVRIGAPFEAGFAYFEPQLTATWSHNDQLAFSESGASGIGNLTYKHRTTNYLQTTAGIKLAFPVRLGTRELFTPTVRVAWLRDWDLQNAPQSIGFGFTNKEMQMTSNQENQNGALIEGGLDYSIANPDGVSVKVYARGGTEIWSGNRGMDWRTSGGVTFEF